MTARAALFLAIAVAACAGNDAGKEAPRQAEAEETTPMTEIPIRNADEAKAAVGKAVSVTGTAENAKLSAAVAGPDLLVYCLGMSSWPAELAGKPVVVTGTLEYTEKFASTVGPDGTHSAGTDGGIYAIRGCKVEPAP